MIGLSQTFVSLPLKIEPGEFILVGFPKQFYTGTRSELSASLLPGSFSVMRLTWVFVLLSACCPDITG